jgi:hypothetical protein
MWLVINNFFCLILLRKVFNLLLNINFGLPYADYAAFYGVDARTKSTMWHHIRSNAMYLGKEKKLKMPLDFNIS